MCGRCRTCKLHHWVLRLLLGQAYIVSGMRSTSAALASKQVSGDLP